MAGSEQRFKHFLHVSDDRRRLVRQDIAEGSEPGIRFYMMVVVSTMIASFGLITNSTAVVIGAMLVAPLMTPIFGMSLALIRSDAQLLGRAAQAEIVGVVAAILMGFTLGTVYPGLEATPEMLARTRPQLFDLLVAVFSGFAGAYALVDEKISPALPGVAIATAIVPPLANTGLCFSLGAYSGGIGSFLLFFSNFLSILLIGSTVFWLFKMTKKYDKLESTVILKRFSLPIIGFLLIAFFLYQSLQSIRRERYLRQSIEQTLESELANIPSSSFGDMIYHEDDGQIYVFANVQSATTISPTQVDILQESLHKKLDQPVELTINSTIAQTVSALDTYSQLTDLDLDGNFIKKTPQENVLKTKIADSVIRSFLAEMPGSVLKLVRLIKRDNQLLVVATIHGLLTPPIEEIRQLESQLRDRIEEPDLDLVIRYLKSELYDRDGKFHFDLVGFVDLTPDQQVTLEKAKTVIDSWFSDSKEQSLNGMSHGIVENNLHLYLDTSGITLFPTEIVNELEQRLLTETGQHVTLHIMSRLQALATANGYVSYETFAERAYKQNKAGIKSEMKKIIENSSL
ncbi:DUF389 domain-containing protein [Desulfosediminicola flagellatus]|uniref:DUF389 domain-containing protein n=1 Tax=Desulfosediminicola flagellatus TaxID=2569541 RepID=UPI0010ACA1CA|nr:DUF389 domain-containing protein [Desulfosediminicola flagellatus]